MRHKNCGGNIVISISNLKILSPGIKFTIDCLIPGVSQLEKVESTSPEFLCKRCSKVFTTEQDFEEIEERCLAGDHFKPVKETLVTQYGVFCTECFDNLCIENKDCEEDLLSIKQILSVSNKVRKVLLSDLMLKPIQI